MSGTQLVLESFVRLVIFFFYNFSKLGDPVIFILIKWALCSAHHIIIIIINTVDVVVVVVVVS